MSVMLFYQNDTGIIVSGTISRQKPFDSTETHSHSFLTDNKGDPIKFERGPIRQYNLAETKSAFKYFTHLKDDTGKPVFKFQFKNGRPSKIVPISGQMPKGWTK